jgi:8-oxo-dGTP pyrophosphatase MutT (NUDIX family)
MENNFVQGEKVAAGGVVVDYRDPDAPRVLVVHRPRYDDWSFPKGKLDAGESIEEAALREVEEETGIRCHIMRKLSTIRYNYRTRAGESRPKVVHYFLMEAAGGQVKIDGDEVDGVEWLGEREAGLRLTYAHDKELLQSVIKDLK